MHTWFQTSIKYEKVAEEGKIVKVTENYLVDALSFTEAEARIIEEITPFISGEFVVSKVTRARISEMFFNDEGDKWFRAKVNFVTLDEEKGIEKKTAVTMMVQANDIEEAITGVREGMKGSMADYEIFSVVTTDIMDVYKYEKEDEEEN